MRVKFLDMQDDANPLNGKWIDNANELKVVLEELRYREPFGLKLDGENGTTLDICLAETVGSVQYTTTGDAYLVAAKPGSIPLPIRGDASPQTLAFLADDKNGLKPLEFLVGGTVTPIPARYILPFNLVREIAIHFFRTGQRQPGLLWEQI